MTEEGMGGEKMGRQGESNRSGTHSRRRAEDGSPKYAHTLTIMTGGKEKKRGRVMICVSLPQISLAQHPNHLFSLPHSLPFLAVAYTWLLSLSPSPSSRLARRQRRRSA